MSGSTANVLPRTLIFALAFCVLALSWLATCGMWHYQRYAAAVAPPEVRRFEKLTVVTLGTGTAYPNPRRRGPALAVGFETDVVLVNAGRGIAEALRAARVPATQPAALLLTNLLPENTQGVDDLWLTDPAEERKTPLQLYGPAGTRSFARGLNATYSEGLRSERGASVNPALPVEEIAAAWSAQVGTLRVSAIPFEAAPFPSLAYRFEAGEHAVVVADVGFAPETLIELAKGADLLVHTAIHGETFERAAAEGAANNASLEREAARYTDADSVSQWAHRAGVAHLVLVGLRPPPLLDFQYTRSAKHHFDGEISLADDGDEFTP